MLQLTPGFLVAIIPESLQRFQNQGLPKVLRLEQDLAIRKDLQRMFLVGVVPEQQRLVHHPEQGILLVKEGLNRV